MRKLNRFKNSINLSLQVAGLAVILVGCNKQASPSSSEESNISADSAGNVQQSAADKAQAYRDKGEDRQNQIVLKQLDNQAKKYEAEQTKDQFSANNASQVAVAKINADADKYKADKESSGKTMSALTTAFGGIAGGAAQGYMANKGEEAKANAQKYSADSYAKSQFQAEQLSQNGQTTRTLITANAGADQATKDNLVNGYLANAALAKSISSTATNRAAVMSKVYNGEPSTGLSAEDSLFYGQIKSQLDNKKITKDQLNQSIKDASDDITKYKEYAQGLENQADALKRASGRGSTGIDPLLLKGAQKYDLNVAPSVGEKKAEATGDKTPKSSQAEQEKADAIQKQSKEFAAQVKADAMKYASSDGKMRLNEEQKAELGVKYNVSPDTFDSWQGHAATEVGAIAKETTDNPPSTYVDASNPTQFSNTAFFSAMNKTGGASWRPSINTASAKVSPLPIPKPVTTAMTKTPDAGANIPVVKPAEDSSQFVCADASDCGPDVQDLYTQITQLKRGDTVTEAELEKKITDVFNARLLALKKFPGNEVKLLEGRTRATQQVLVAALSHASAYGGNTISDSSKDIYAYISTEGPKVVTLQQQSNSAVAQMGRMNFNSASTGQLGSNQTFDSSLGSNPLLAGENGNAINQFTDTPPM